jgi:MFS transporter, BCD family, chlorophyll transporter
MIRATQKPGFLAKRSFAALAAAGPRFLPFADVASPDLPLSRLIRLSLFQITVGMAMVLLAGTLNRVMIVELGVPAALVATMLALPLLFAPFRALIGFRSDRHRSALGWRRVPYIWKGTMLQFGGLAVMPFALLVLAGKGHAASAPLWIGQAGAAIAFLLVGAGLHMVQTVGLALATDLAPPEDHPNIVGLMYVMLLIGMIASALLFGWALMDFSPGRLIQVIQASAVATVVLNVAALWKMEARQPRHAQTGPQGGEADFVSALRGLLAYQGAARRLAVIVTGSMAFGMADVLLEPYGGQILQMGVGATTKLTATLAFGSLIGFAVASRVLSRGFDPMRMAAFGVAAGIPGFALVILAGSVGETALFVAGTGLVGLGAGLFGHGTLTATMRLAPPGETGLALGAWGAAQATSAGVAVAAGGVIRDLMQAFDGGALGAAAPYVAVYALEIALLAVTLAIALRTRGR